MRASLACLFAVCSATVIATALALLFGHLSAFIAIISLGAGLCGAIYIVVSRQPGRIEKPFGLPDWLIMIAFILFALRSFCWVVYNADDEVRALSSYNLGDMSVHLTYIRYLAKGATFWLEHPLFSGVKFHYPLGVDLFNSLLSLVGVETYRGLIWVALIASAITWVALYRWGGWFAVAGFLFNGG